MKEENNYEPNLFARLNAKREPDHRTYGTWI